MRAKNVVHSEYFRTVSLGGRKSCPSCHSKLLDNEKVWSWGEYHAVRWYTVTYFCRECFAQAVQAPLQNHRFHCHCSFQLVGYRGETLPQWLTLEDRTVCTV